MAAESAISWLARQTLDGTWHQGHTLNPWSGCYVKSPGCRECYAKNLPPSMRRGAVWGKNASRVLAPDSYLAQVHAWSRAAAKLGIRMPVFCASTADIFERHAVAAENDDLNRQRAKVWALVAETPWLDWLFLTKEPENILDMIPAEWVAHGCPSNVWMGCTVENQEAADTRIPHLLRVPAVVRFLSIEPMIGPVDLGLMALTPGNSWRECLCAEIDPSDRPCVVCEAHGIHWILCGGESGRGANVRPMHPAWARSLRDQCVAAGVAFHFKQWGAWARVGSVDTYSHGPDKRQRAYPDSEGIAWLADGRICKRDFTVAQHAARMRAGEAQSTRAIEVDEQALADWHNAAAEDRAAYDRMAYEWMYRVGKHASGRMLDGRTWDELPDPQPLPTPEVPRG